MIPLYWFLLAWAMIVGIFLLSSLITLLMHLRYGLAGIGTFGSGALFIAVSGLVLLFTITYLLGVDWTQSVDILGPSFSWLPLN